VEPAFVPGAFAGALDALAFAADAFALSERDAPRPHDAAASMNASAAAVQQAPGLLFLTAAVRVQGRCRVPCGERADPRSADLPCVSVCAVFVACYGLRTPALHVSRVRRQLTS